MADSARRFAARRWPAARSGCWPTSTRSPTTSRSTRASATAARAASGSRSASASRRCGSASWSSEGPGERAVDRRPLDLVADARPPRPPRPAPTRPRPTSRIARPPDRAAQPGGRGADLGGHSRHRPAGAGRRRQPPTPTRPDLVPRGLVGAGPPALSRWPAKPTPDPRSRPARPGAAAPPAALDLEIFDPSLAEVSTERKIELLRAIERSARAADPRIAAHRESSATATQFGTVALASSRGLAASYERSWASDLADLLARQDGEALRGYGQSHRPRLRPSFGRGGRPPGGAAGGQAARRSAGPDPARDRRDGAGGRGRAARPGRQGASPARRSQKGRSMYRRTARPAGRLGAGHAGGRRQSAAARLLRRRSTAEGIPGQRTVLVEQGLAARLPAQQLLGSPGRRPLDRQRRSRRATASMPDVGPTNFALVGPVDAAGRAARRASIADCWW